MMDIYKDHIIKFLEHSGATEISFRYHRALRGAVFPSMHELRFKALGKPYSIYYDPTKCVMEEFQFSVYGIQELMAGGTLESANDIMDAAREKHNRYINPRYGDTREEDRYYWFPRRIGGKWMRRGRVKKIYVNRTWEDLEWLKTL